MEESVVFTFPCQVNGNHATESSTVCHVISERHWKSTFDFTEIVNNYGLKLGTVCKILRFISQFSLKLYIQLLKYFHSMVSGSLGRGCCGKNSLLKFLANISTTSAPLSTFLAFKSCKAIDTLKVINVSKKLKF